MKGKNINQRCREVIRACLNIVEEKGDTYIAIHKDDDVECVVIVSMLHTYPIISIVIADKILFSKENESDMYRTANALNSESLVGWHTLMLTDSQQIYMYRQCLWIDAGISRDHLLELLCNSIEEYKRGRKALCDHDIPSKD